MKVFDVIQCDEEEAAGDNVSSRDTGICLLFINPVTGDASRRGKATWQA